jgi:hypothetical protein
MINHQKLNCCLIAAITINYPVMSMTILGKEFRVKIQTQKKVRMKKKNWQAKIFYTF